MDYPSFVLLVVVIVALVAAVLVIRGRPWSVLGTKFDESQTLESCVSLVKQYLEARRFMEAMVVCKKAIKAAPNDPQGHVMLARVYQAQGKLDRAAKVLHEVLQAHPGHLEAAQLLAGIQSDGGKRPIP